MKKAILILIILVSFGLPVFSQNVGSAAPDFTLDKLGGGTFKLSDNKGKVVFIFFFGYACPHCLANGPNTQSGIYEVYKENPNFVAVGVDTWDGNSAGVTNFKSSTNIEYTLCLMGSAIESAYQTTYDRIVILDKNGIIKYKATSDATSPVVAQASSVIENLLGSEMEEEEEEEEEEEGTITSLNETAGVKQNVTVFPSTANNTLLISSGILDNGDFTVRIFDINGGTVLTNEFQRSEEETISIPMPVVADGMYILLLTSNDYRITKKFIVKK